MMPSILGWMFIRQRSPRPFWMFHRQVGDGVHPRNESGNDSAVYSRSAWQPAVTFEEGSCAAWLHDLLRPHVTQVLVSDPPEECAAESRQQKRSHRFAEAR